MLSYIESLRPTLERPCYQEKKKRKREKPNTDSLHFLLDKNAHAVLFPAKEEKETAVMGEWHPRRVKATAIHCNRICMVKQHNSWKQE